MATLYADTDVYIIFSGLFVTSSLHINVLLIQ